MLAFWPAIAFPLPRLPRSQGPSCPRRQSIATPGGLRSIPPKYSARAKMRVSNCLTARSLASFGARQRTLIDAVENGSIDLALRYEISVGFTPRLERSLGIGAEELEQQRVVGFDPCLRKAMTAMVELDETRMCNLLGN